MTLYALPDGARWGVEAADGIDPLPNGWRHLGSAADLWRLVDPGRADAISAALDRAIDAGPDGHPWFPPAELEDLTRLLYGLEDALQSAEVIDQHWFVDPERLPQLATRVPALDTDPTRDDWARRQALAEVLVDVIGVR